MIDVRVITCKAYVVRSPRLPQDEWCLVSYYYYREFLSCVTSLSDMKLCQNKHQLLLQRANQS